MRPERSGPCPPRTSRPGVERTDETAYLRADNRRHCVEFVRGGPRTLSSTFTVAEGGALEEAARHLASIGGEVHRGTDAECAERHVKEFISFRDTGRNVVELVTGQTHFESRPVRFDPVHHKLAVFYEETGLGHVNFQVDSIDDLMCSWNFLKYHGVEIVMGPGRHPQSTAMFLYFHGPEDVTWEYSHGVRRIPEDMDWRPRRFEVTEPDFIDMWKGALANPGPRWADRQA